MNRFPKLIMLGAGLLSAIGFAPLGVWPVTLACLALMIRCVAIAPNLRAALARGYMFGVGHFITGLNWIAGAFAYQDTMPVWLGWVAVTTLAFYIAVYPALAAGIAWFGRSNGKSFVIMFGGSWIVTEWLRATMFTGFAWNPLGAIWLPLIGVPRAIAPWLGTYGLGGFTILIAGALAYLVPKWLDRVRILARAGRTEWLSLVIGPVIAGAAIIFGAFSMKYVALPEPDAAQQPLIRIVQPNIGQQDKHVPAYERVNFAKLVSLTGKPGPIPRLILWPEAAVPDFLEEEEWAREKLAALIGPKDLLMTGGVALIYNDDNELTGARNAMFTLTPDAKIVARYDKAHLVPYGEYLPMKPILSLIGLTRLVPGTVDFIPGPGAQSLTVPGFGKVGIQICYEIIFSGDVVDSANRPDFLFNPSNDAWFGAWGPPQHLAQARLRAIEEGISVVRATPTGISAIIDPNGRIRQALPYQKPGYIEARVPRSHAPTLFAQHGNILPLGLSLLLIVLGIALRAKRR